MANVIRAILVKIDLLKGSFPMRIGISKSLSRKRPPEKEDEHKEAIPTYLINVGNWIQIV